MAPRTILYPMLALVLLTAVVAVLVYRRRVAEMRSRRITPQRVATSTQMAALLEDTRAADNYRNLFEAPVLFYAAVLTIYASQLTSAALVTVAWAFVGARVVHSTIQCSYNTVIHRLVAFLTSMALLAMLWALIAWDILAAGRG